MIDAALISWNDCGVGKLLIVESLRLSRPRLSRNSAAENLWNRKSPPGTADERCGIWKRARNESARRIDMIGEDDAAGSVDKADQLRT